MAKDTATKLLARVRELREARGLSQEAFAEKAAYVIRVMSERLLGLGASWELVTAADVYTAHSIQPILETILRPGLSVAARQGVHLIHARPPIVDIEFEMDLRGVCTEELRFSSVDTGLVLTQ